MNTDTPTSSTSDDLNLSSRRPVIWFPRDLVGQVSAADLLAAAAAFDRCDNDTRTFFWRATEVGARCGTSGARLMELLERLKKAGAVASYKRENGEVAKVTMVKVPHNNRAVIPAAVLWQYAWIQSATTGPRHGKKTHLLLRWLLAIWTAAAWSKDGMRATCTVSIATIAKTSGLSIDQVKKAQAAALKVAADQPWLTAEQTKRDDLGLDCYNITLNWHAAPSLQAPPVETAHAPARNRPDPEGEERTADKTAPGPATDDPRQSGTGGHDDSARGPARNRTGSGNKSAPLKKETSSSSPSSFPSSPSLPSAPSHDATGAHVPHEHAPGGKEGGKEVIGGGETSIATVAATAVPHVPTDSAKTPSTPAGMAHTESACNSPALEPDDADLHKAMTAILRAGLGPSRHPLLRPDAATTTSLDDQVPLSYGQWLLGLVLSLAEAANPVPLSAGHVRSVWGNQTLRDLYAAGWSAKNLAAVLTRFSSPSSSPCGALLYRLKAEVPAVPNTVPQPSKTPAQRSEDALFKEQKSYCDASTYVTHEL